MPDLSVVLPVYHEERYLSEAVHSVLQQTFSDFELILVCDDLTESTFDIIKGFLAKDNRIRMVRGKRKGLSSALNEGIVSSSGKYIARMDADDICYTRRFEKQIELLEQNSDLYLIGTRFELLFESDIDDGTKKEVQVFYENVHEPIDYENNKESILEGYKILHPTWMFRRELVEQIGMYRNCVSEDNEFLFRAAVNGYYMGRVEEVLLKYRISNFSNMGRNRESQIRIQKRFCIEFKLQYLQEKFPDIFEKMKYVIWGADISGELAYGVIQEKFPRAYMVAFIDGIKTGMRYGMPIYSAEECFDKEDFDYVFICTRGGARSAMEFMKKKKMVMERDYFKIV